MFEPKYADDKFKMKDGCVTKIRKWSPTLTPQAQSSERNLPGTNFDFLSINHHVSFYC